MFFHPLPPVVVGPGILILNTIIAIVLTHKVNYYLCSGEAGWFRKLGLFEIFWFIGLPLVLLAIPLRLLGVRLFPVFVNPDRV